MRVLHSAEKSIAPHIETEFETQLRWLSREVERLVERAGDAVEDAGGDRPEFTTELKEFATLIAGIRAAKCPPPDDGLAAKLARLDELVDGLLEELRVFISELAAKLARGTLAVDDLPNMRSLMVMVLGCRLNQGKRGWKPRRPTEN